MLTIHKYLLKPGMNQVNMTSGARILSVRNQGGEIMLWALVDTTDFFFSERSFLVATTGGSICEDPAKLNFIGTVEMEGGWIGHVFEVLP